MSSGTFIYSYTGEIADYLASVSELLKKLLKRGLMILQDLASANGVNEQTNAIVLLHRNAMALLDALSELSRLPSVETLKIVCRSFLETKCHLEYILEAETVPRAVAYQTHHIMSRIGNYQQYDSSTMAGERFRSRLQKDRLFGPLDLIKIDTKPAIDNLQQQLNREPFKTAFEKLRKDKKLHWYSIDGGPKNMRELCEHLHYPIAYDYLYSQLSESVHAAGAYTNSFFGQKGQGQMHALRAMSGYQDLINIMFPLIVDFFTQITQKILPDHHARLVRFYKNIYKPFREVHIDNIIVKGSP